MHLRLTCTLHAAIYLIEFVVVLPTTSICCCCRLLQGARGTSVAFSERLSLALRSLPASYLACTSCPCPEAASTCATLESSRRYAPLPPPPPTINSHKAALAPGRVIYHADRFYTSHTDSGQIAEEVVAARRASSGTSSGCPAKDVLQALLATVWGSGTYRVQPLTQIPLRIGPHHVHASCNRIAVDAHPQDEAGRPSLSEKEVVDNVKVLLFAGSDTTAWTLAWSLWYIASNPAAQERLAAELAACPSEESLEELDKLPYLAAVVNEARGAMASLHPA